MILSKPNKDVTDIYIPYAHRNMGKLSSGKKYFPLKTLFSLLSKTFSLKPVRFSSITIFKRYF